MRHFVIGLDSLSPKKSKLILGPELDDAAVISEFRKLRSESVPVEGFPVLLLYGPRGQIETSIARGKASVAAKELKK